MSLIFFILLLFSFPNSILSIKDDEITLLKIKKQLGNPDSLRSWVKGFEFCGFKSGPPMTPYPEIEIECTDTGHVSSLIMVLINATAPFPGAICSLTKLEVLYLSYIPGLYGSIPSCITKLSNLSQLYLAHTSLSGSVPRFHNQTNLTQIYLSFNQLSGTIPSSLSTLPNLQYLNLESNHLRGTIPPGLVTQPSSSLVLANNNLTGAIPRSYGMVDFEVFNAAGNQLTGDASFLFGKQKMTMIVILANNALEFDLSYVEFSDRLTGFNLGHNKIYGKVPDSLATAARLKVPILSFNRLCGALPQGARMSRFKPEYFANNTCLCGYPLPPCSNPVPAPAPAPAPAASPVSAPPF